MKRQPMSIDWQKVSSPSYILDEKCLLDNLTFLEGLERRAGIKIILALKSFGMFSVFPLIGKHLTGSAVSSLHETRLSFEEMGGEIHAYAPVYQSEEMEYYLDHCKHITFNSLSQWETFAEKIKNSSSKISCGFRINPEYSEVKADIYNPCCAGSRFGIRAEELDEKLPEGIEGLFFHSLCQSGAETLKRTLEVIEKKFGKYLHEVKWLNMGGGHFLTNKEYDIELLIKTVKYFKKKYDLEIILEPGEGVIYKTGALLCKVLDIVKNEGIQTAILDISFTAHIPDCLEMPFRPGIMGAKPAHVAKETYRMGGRSCLAGDYIQAGDYSFDKALEIGDRIVFENMMPYTMVQTTYFNGIKHPDICIWTKEKELKTIRTFGFEDYKMQLS